MEKGKKRLATLVGINYTRSPKYKLHGCINDVLAIKEMLQNTFKFNESNIKFLTDDRCNLGTDRWPTGKNIKLAINKMIDEAEEGDVLCFYFSGHGTLLPNPDNAEQPDDAIVPCDFNLITDVDFRNFVDRVPNGASFTIFADACHSGGLVYKEKEQIGPIAIPNNEKITETSPVRGIPIEFIAQQLIEQLKSKNGNVLNIESLDVGALLSQTFGYASSLKILVRTYLVSLSTNPALGKLLEAGSQFYVKNKATFEKAAANLAAAKESALAAAKDAADVAKDAAKDAAKQVADAAKDAAENAAAAAKDAAAAAKDAAKDAAAAAKDAAADAAAAAKDAAKDAAAAAATAAKDAAKDAAAAAKDAAIDAAAAAKDAAKDAASAGVNKLLGATGAAAVVNKLRATSAYVLGAFFFFLVRVMQAFAIRIQALGIGSRLFPAANDLVVAGNAHIAAAANDLATAGNAHIIAAANDLVAAAANDLVVVGNDLVAAAGNKLLAAGNNLLVVGNDFVSAGNDLFAAAGNDLLAACNDIVSAAGDDLVGIIGSDFIKVLCAESVAIGSDLFKALNDASRKFSLKDRKDSENADAGILLSGCQTNETSKDAKATGDGEEAGGAFSKALRTVLEEHKSAPVSYRKVVIKIRKIIRDRGYTQHPCLYCGDQNADKPFLGFKR